MTTLLSIATADAVWLQLLRFLLGSTILIVISKLIIASGLVRQLRIQALLWKCTLVASLVLLIPMPSTLVPSVTLPAPVPGLQETVEFQQVNTSVAFDVPELSTQAALSTPSIDSQAFLNQSIAGGTYSALLLLFWMVVAAMLVVRQKHMYKRELGRLGPRYPVPVYTPLRRSFVGQCRQKKIYPLPRLTSSDRLASPITLAGNEICLPKHMLNSFSHEEATCVLAHELGHIKNRDLQLMAAMQLIVSLFFFQPLLRIVQRELLDLAEFIADQEAAIDQQSANTLANALLNCACNSNAIQQPVFAAAMVGKASRLRLRVQQLIGDGPFATHTPGLAVRATLIAGMLSSAVLLPTFAQAPSSQVDESGTRTIYEPTACNVAAYEAIVDQVHAGIVTPAGGLGRWEQSCGTNSGKTVDAAWQRFDLPDHHLWVMANSDDLSSAGQKPTMALLYRAWLASQALREHTHMDEHTHEHDQAH